MRENARPPKIRKSPKMRTRGFASKNLENPEIRKTRKTKIQVVSHTFWEFRPENPFPEVPQSSCIFWDGQGPFSRRFTFSTFSDLEQIAIPDEGKTQKRIRNWYLLPFPWRNQPLGPCPNQRAPDLEVHSRIESSVRPNGTPVMPLLHFGHGWLFRSKTTNYLLCKFSYEGNNNNNQRFWWQEPLGKIIFVLFCFDTCRDEEKETQNINVVGINKYINK